MSVHARLVSPVIKPEPVQQVERQLYWKDLDKSVPSAWRNTIQRLFSYLPLVSQPAAFYVKMRGFININMKSDQVDQPVSAELLPELLSVFDETIEFEQEKSDILITLSKKQINRMTDHTFHLLLQKYADNKENIHLNFVLPKFAVEKFKYLFRSIEAKLTLLITRQKIEDPIRVKPSPIKPELIVDIQWCGHLRENFSLDERKEIVKLTYDLLLIRCKPLIQNFLTNAELLQHIQAIHTTDIYTHIWKEEIITTAERRFRLIFENKDELKTLLKVLTQEEKFNLFCKLLANQNFEERFQILNNFFQCTPRMDHSYILNHLILNAHESLYYQNNLKQLLQGKVPALHIAPFTYLMAEYHFGKMNHQIAMGETLDQFDLVIDQIKESLPLFTVAAKSYGMDILIEKLQAEICHVLDALKDNKTMIETWEEEDRNATHLFMTRFNQLIQGKSQHTEQTVSQELRLIITRLPSGTAFKEALPSLKATLEKLYTLYHLRDSAAFRGESHTPPPRELKLPLQPEPVASHESDVSMRPLR